MSIWEKEGHVGLPEAATHVLGALARGAAPRVCVGLMRCFFVRHLDTVIVSMNNLVILIFVQFREYFLNKFSEKEKWQKSRNWHCGILLIG